MRVRIAGAAIDRRTSGPLPIAAISVGKVS
jgi:hypothetical protein